MKEFPKYRSHKVVGAVKVQDVEKCADGGLIVSLEDGFDSITLTHAERLHKPQPHKGWYAVKYSNDHLSFSPADAFEEGYTAIEEAGEPVGEEVPEPPAGGAPAKPKVKGGKKTAEKTPETTA